MTKKKQSFSFIDSKFTNFDQQLFDLSVKSMDCPKHRDLGSQKFDSR